MNPSQLTPVVPSPKIDLAAKSVDPLQQAADLIISETHEDPCREGILRTPHRFAKAYRHFLSGYSMSLRDAIGEGVFDTESNGIVSVNSVEFYSMCEHHIVPFWGQASVSYIPNEKILGLSKIPRIIELVTRRLQVQERITREIADAIKLAIDPKAVFVKVKAKHMCMMMRGVEKQHSDTATEMGYGLENLGDYERDRLISSCELT